jgi:large subunit ribosomal protein L9
VKVIFLEDVSGIARAGQTRVVADGYARNYLLPRKLAVLAGSAASTAVEAQLRRIAKRQALEEAEMTELAKKLDGVEITLEAKVGESEKLYGSVTAADIAAALSEPAGQEVDKRKIELHEPIRHLGSHDVNVRFTHDITAVIKVTVRAEEPEKAEKKTRAEAEEVTAETAVEEAPVEASGADATVETPAETAAEGKTEAAAEAKPAAGKKTKAKAKTTAKAKTKAKAKAEAATEEKTEKPEKKTKVKAATKAKKTKKAEAKAAKEAKGKTKEEA